MNRLPVCIPPPCNKNQQKFKLYYYCQVRPFFRNNISTFSTLPVIFSSSTSINELIRSPASSLPRICRRWRVRQAGCNPCWFGSTGETRRHSVRMPIQTDYWQSSAMNTSPKHALLNRLQCH